MPPYAWPHFGNNFESLVKGYFFWGTKCSKFIPILVSSKLLERGERKLNGRTGTPMTAGLLGSLGAVIAHAGSRSHAHALVCFAILFFLPGRIVIMVFTAAAKPLQRGVDFVLGWRGRYYRYSGSGIEAAHPELKANMVAGRNIYDSNTDTNDICGHGAAVASSAGASSNKRYWCSGHRWRRQDHARAHSHTGTIPTVTAARPTARSPPASLTQRITARALPIPAMASGGQSVGTKRGALYEEQRWPSVRVGRKRRCGRADRGRPGDGRRVIHHQFRRRSSFSSYGSVGPLAASGSEIWTIVRNSACGSKNGTSFSSPIAAGVAAMMMSARPDLSPDTIQSLLYANAVDLGTVGRDIYYGHGRVNAAAAVSAAKNYAAPADIGSPSTAISACWAAPQFPVRWR